MKFRIESPGHRLSPSLKAFITDKLGGLNKFYKDIQEVEVTVLHETKGNKEVITCTLNIRVPGKDEYLKAKSPIFEDAILKVAETAKKRLRVRKTQLQAAKKRQTPNRKVAAKVSAKVATKKAPAKSKVKKAK